MEYPPGDHATAALPSESQDGTKPGQERDIDLSSATGKRHHTQAGGLCEES